MRLFKHMCLVALGVVALGASFGASGASATVLCSTKTDPCTSPYPAGTEINATLSTATSAFETTGGTVLDTCTGGSLGGTVESAGGASSTPRIKIPKWLWSGCSKTTDLLGGGVVEIHHVEGSFLDGTITVVGLEETINTIFGSCIYGAGATASHWGTIPGDAIAKWIILKIILKKLGGNALCPAEIRWSAEYSTTSPQPLYISGS